MVVEVCYYKPHKFTTCLNLVKSIHKTFELIMLIIPYYHNTIEVTSIMFYDR